VATENINVLLEGPSALGINRDASHSGMRKAAKAQRSDGAFPTSARSARQVSKENIGER